MSTGNMSRRIDKLERVLPAAPTDQEYQEANTRFGARMEQDLRLGIEWELLQLAKGKPFEFGPEVGAMIGLPDLWDPSLRAEVEQTLRGDTPAQARADHDVVRRYRLLRKGVDIGSYVNLGLGLGKRPTGQVVDEAFLRAEAQEIAALYEIDAEGLLEESAQVRAGFDLFEARMAEANQ